MVTAANKTRPYIPLAGSANDGWSTKDQATATCYCGAVQLAFPTQGPGIVDTFVCHCTDCRKITASMFTTAFIIADTYLKHLRGQEALKNFSQSKTTTSGKAMTNCFCSSCGTLMYRTSEEFPGHSILRTGTVDDFSLHETKLKPKVEVYTKDRVGWLCSANGVDQIEGASLH
ncbi:Mss4-like protein [Aspergillus pseudoustus]|uniref:Mss4-like protein n=1 Tax=Aspergillus pseudoustus TaxID=1810923 RepID=A0ABR4J1S7_9EURO